MMKFIYVILLLAIIPLTILQANVEIMPASNYRTVLKNHVTNPFIINADKVQEILQESGLTIDELLVELIPLVKHYARPPISNYQVGVVGVGKSGNIYAGVNLEFSGFPLNQAVHAEQFLISNARSHGETELITLALSAAPCGHCRQFLNEISESGNLIILIPNNPPKTLNELLPHSFGPADLGLIGGLLSTLKVPHFNNNQPLLFSKALEAVFASYAPYSQSRSGVAIQMSNGRIFTGSYLENAAYNPSLAPLQTALVNLVSAMEEYNNIEKVLLVEETSAKISQEMITREILKKIAPNAEFLHKNVNLEDISEEVF